jgi:hypothetical protein
MCLLLQKYKDAGHDTIILAGAEYGSGSSRDWAAKGPYLQVSKHLIRVPTLKQSLYCLEIRLLLHSNSWLRM